MSKNKSCAVTSETIIPFELEIETIAQYDFSQLDRSFNNKLLYGEYGIPCKDIARLTNISFNNISHTITKLEHDEIQIDDATTKYIVRGELRPYGPYKDALILNLNNNNVSFKLRTINVGITAVVITIDAICNSESM